MKPTLIAIAAVLLPHSLSSQARQYPLESTTGLRLNNVAAEAATLDGKKGVRVTISPDVERQAAAWPDWAVTTAIDTRAVWRQVWRAVQCHASQVAGYSRLAEVSPEHHETIWGRQEFYRVWSRVSGGREPESDLFEGLRCAAHTRSRGCAGSLSSGSPSTSPRTPSPTVSRTSSSSAISA